MTVYDPRPQERQSLVLCMINNLRAARSEQICGLKLIEGQAISE